MKPFTVSRYIAEAVADFRVNNPNGLEERRYAWYHSFLPRVNAGINDPYYEGQMVWYADDENSAVALAKSLAHKFPGQSFVVAKSNDVYMCPAGPVQHSKFSTKGLLPA